MKVFISAGEASGDAYGAALVRELAKISPVAAQGLGGAKLAAAGMDIVVETSSWGAIGVAQALSLAPRVAKGLRRAKAALRQSDPGLFIPIDFGYVNIGLARYAKGLGWRVLYFIPPGSWRRGRQGKDLPGLADEVVTPFPWSAEILRGIGASAHWFGHPIKQLMAHAPAPPEDGADGIAILPGSRAQEIKRNLPVIASAIRDWPEKAEIAIAQTVDGAGLRRMWIEQSGRGGDRFTGGDVYGVLRRARAAIVCSGTATLEAALCRCPFVVVYQVSRSVALQARLAGLKDRPISLPNILLERPVVPELVYRGLTPALLEHTLRRLMEDEAERRRQILDFEELDAMLGPADAITQTARLAVALMASRSEAKGRA